MSQDVSIPITLSTAFAIRPHIAFPFSVPNRSFSCVFLTAFFTQVLPTCTVAPVVLAAGGIFRGCVLLGAVWDAWFSSVLVGFIWVEAGRGFGEFSANFLAFFFRLFARVMIGASELLSTMCKLAEFYIIFISQIGSGVGGCRFARFAANLLPAFEEFTAKKGIK